MNFTTCRDLEADLRAAEAQVERLQATQRTPGTVEVCESCGRRTPVILMKPCSHHADGTSDGLCPLNKALKVRPAEEK